MVCGRRFTSFARCCKNKCYKEKEGPSMHRKASEGRNSAVEEEAEEEEEQEKEKEEEERKRSERGGL